MPAPSSLSIIKISASGSENLSVPLHQQKPNEITKESLVRILEIMYRLAAPEALPKLLHEIIEVGKIAIVAEGGALWLRGHAAGESRDDLLRVVPAADEPARLRVGEGLAGACAQS